MHRRQHLGQFVEICQIIQCRIAPHILPAPYALKVTNLAPEQVTNNNLQTAFDFSQNLYQFLEKWQPAIWIGYNTISFDEPMLRQLFYQNLQPNIYATSMNGNSRLDVMKMVWAAHSLRPEILTFPENDKGKTSFKLDQLAPANGFAHENAHDALADVEATIFILNKIKSTDPDFFDDLVRTQDREYIGSLLRSFEPVQVTLRFGGASPKTYYGCYCGTNIQNKNEIEKVIVRMSDFKSNEYFNLVGGYQYEPDEENPMLGFRGATRIFSNKQIFVVYVHLNLQKERIFQKSLIQL